jgi:hypothetical protein
MDLVGMDDDPRQLTSAADKKAVMVGELDHQSTA